MSERVLVEFVCPGPRHILARVVATGEGSIATGEGIAVVFPALVYLDDGNKPGTVKNRRLPVEHRRPLLGEFVWGETVMCGCKRRRHLSQPAVESQVREWQKFNAHSIKPRRVILDSVISASQYNLEP
jgi:hypothetical protein